MPKYLFEASYTVDGLEGLLKDGGSKRREDLHEAVKQLGGTLEAFILLLEMRMFLALRICRIT